MKNCYSAFLIIGVFLRSYNIIIIDDCLFCYLFCTESADGFTIVYDIIQSLHCSRNPTCIEKILHKVLTTGP